MPLEYKSGVCVNCNEVRKVFRNKPNHLLHLLLTFLTGGVWAIVWIFVAIRFGGWRCDHCGNGKISDVR